MKLKPLADRVVIKSIEAVETTKSGIVLPGSAKEKPQVAEVVAVGPGGMVDGKEVSMLVFGSSMAPFLIHARDMIYFKKPDRELQKGDIVFFRRKSGQFVMHRIWKIRPEGYYIVGDAQTQIEGPVKREQIFALITKVRRKEKWLEPGDFWWEFFEHVWLHMIPLRRGIMWCYAKVIK